MPSLSPWTFSRRGSSRAALLCLLMSGVTIAADAPTSAPSDSDAEATTQPEGRRGPPIRSLDEVRLDRRMTLLNAGERLEPTQRLPDDAAEYVVELPSHKELILDLAARNGRPAPRVRLLPEESRTPDRYGIVTADHALLRKSPVDERGDRENLSDVTKGEPVWILDANEEKTSLLVHANDGYLGWVDAATVWTVGKAEFMATLARLQIRETGPLNGDFHLERAPVPSFEESLRRRDAAAFLRAATANPPGWIRHQDSWRVKEIAKTSNAYLGTRYVWGGKTTDGIDCSGLAQAAMVSVGVSLPRDADQQSLVGRLVATRWEQSALRPGDLLFYVSPGRGHVNHVAIYLGDGDYIEAAGKDVHVSSMTPGKPNYDAKRAAAFGWARRVIE